MNVRKRLLCLALCAVIAVCAAACGGAVDSGDPTVGRVWYFGSGAGEADFAPVSHALDPDALYRTIPFDARMLYGDYSLNNEDREKVHFQKEAAYEKIRFAVPDYAAGGTELMTALASTLPNRITAGQSALSSDPEKTHLDRGNNWAVLTFSTKNDYGDTYNGVSVTCAYTVEGTTVTYRPLDYFEVVRDRNFHVRAIHTTVSDRAFTYEYSIRGPYLRLTKGERSVTLCATGFAADDRGGPSISGCLAPGGVPIAQIGSLHGDAVSAAAYRDALERTLPYDGFAMKVCENGLLTLRWMQDGVPQLRQFVYFDCGGGVILADGDGVYDYSECAATLEQAPLPPEAPPERPVTVTDPTLIEYAEAVEKKENLIDDLAAAFEAAGLSVTANEETGELSMDASVLFAGDSAVLTGEGIAFLDRFVAIYTEILSSETYRGFVTKTVIEGHTAPIRGSTYENGMPLSEKRAETVLDYCMQASGNALVLEAVGMSNSVPVVDAAGAVDLAASRRVSFRVVVDLPPQ